jgi:hypothetical protein
MMGVLNAAPHGDNVTEKVEFGPLRRPAVIAIAMALLGRDWS